MELSKMHGLGFLLMLLVVALIINPRAIHNMYSNILGRVVLIGVIIIFAMNNVTLGLLVALCIIIASNMFMFEGNTNMSDALPESMPELSDMEKEKEKEKKKEKTGTEIIGEGVDRESVKASIASKDSSTLPVSKPVSTEDVAATSVKEAFSMGGGYSYLG